MRPHDDLSKMEVHQGKEYGGRMQEEPNSTQAHFVLDAIALECTPQKALDLRWAAEEGAAMHPTRINHKIAVVFHIATS